MIRLAPPASECLVLTLREGLLSSFGHDLEIAVTRFDVRVDEAARRVDASFDAASLRVLRPLRDGAEVANGLSDANRKSIEDAIRKDVLESNRFPEIRYRSTRVVEAADGFDVAGKLSLHGKERDVPVALRRAGDRYTAEVTLDQREFAIRPYSAFLGALKVKPEVVVRLSFPAPPAA